MKPVQDPTTGEMIPTPEPVVAIRVRYSAATGTLTARGHGQDIRSDWVRVAYDPGLPMSTNAAVAAQAWIDKLITYKCELLPHSFVYGSDRFFSYHITGGQRAI